MVVDFTVFLGPTADFFLLNLIETVCSQSLRTTLTDLRHWRLMLLGEPSDLGHAPDAGPV